MKRGAVETYRADPNVDRVASIAAAGGGFALLGWGGGSVVRVVGTIVVFLAVGRWLGVNKRAVFQTDEFLVLRGALFSRRLAWSEVASAAVARRGPAYFGLVVTAADGRTYRPGGVGYVGFRPRMDQPVDQLAAAINARIA
jgi:hypothetical protein